MKQQTIWMRLGDGGEYEEFGSDLHAVAGMLSEFNIQHIEPHGRYGVSAPGFEGQNYISLFWGDKDAEAERDLTPTELDKINRCLEREARRHPSY